MNWSIRVQKAEQREVKVDVGLPAGNFQKVMYFNRFRIEREEGICLVQFGLVAASSLLDSYSCVLPQEALKQNQNALLEYLGQLGRPVGPSQAVWKGISIERGVEVGDIIGMSVRGDLAETCIYVFSLCGASRAAKMSIGDDSVEAQPLALLRCATELQKHLIVALYEE